MNAAKTENDGINYDDPIRRMWEAELSWWADDVLKTVGGTTALSQTKRRQTIVAIIVAELFDAAFDRPQFWRRRDVASPSSYNKYRTDGSPFLAVLEGLRRRKVEFRRHMADQMAQEAVALIGQETLASVRTLKMLRDSADAESVRVAAANSLLDRNPLTAKSSRQQITGKDDGPVEFAGRLDEGEREARLQQLIATMAQRVQAEGDDGDD